MIRYLVLGVTYAFAAAVQPGPLQAYLISQTMAKGWRRTAPAAFAPLISDGPILFITLLLLSRVPDFLVRILQCAGGLLLLFLAAGAGRAWRRYDEEKVRQGAPGQQTLLRAALVNFLNPNPYLGWSLVMGPLLLQGWREAPANGVALVAAFYLTIVLCLFGFIVLFGVAEKAGPRIGRTLLGLSAVALAGFGVYQLLMGTGILD